MNKFFLAVCDAFNDAANKQLFTDAGLPTIKTIDKFRGQPLAPEQFELFELPAIFIGKSVKWEKEGKFYNGTMTVHFHVVQDATWAISNISTNQEEGLKQLTFLAMVRQVLDGLESDNTGKLIRSEDNEADADVSIYDVLTYTCSYYDPVVSGKKYVDAAGENLNIEKGLKEEL